MEVFDITGMFLAFSYRFHAGLIRAPMPFWVYILECSNAVGENSYYTGYTNNLQRRVREHSTGRGARYTKGKRLELKYCEIHPTQREAMRREIAIKRLSRAKKGQLFQQFHNQST
jgi:putative endonuclease